MSERERGWKASNKLICLSCVGDQYLKGVLQEAVDAEEACSFCGNAPAADFDVFMQAFMVGVENAFEQADDAGLPWENEYVYETYDVWDILDKFAWVAAGEHPEKVMAEIRDCLEDKTYASRWWIELEPDQAYSSAWSEFREQILHRTRFVFWAARDGGEQHPGNGEVSVANVLQAIGRLLERFELIKTLPAGTLIYRARGHSRQEDSLGWAAADLGTNLPANTTSSSRMSPPGIPLFYGADDLDTALAEVGRADSREFFTAGQFATTQPMTIVDLTNVPEVPSIFDPRLGGSRGELTFLNDLVTQLREPIDTARSNVDYVPTQVFCEYFLRVFDTADVRGLAWTSAAAAGHGRCLALDIAHEDCVDTAGPAGRLQLRLVEGSVTVHQRHVGQLTAALGSDAASSRPAGRDGHGLTRSVDVSAARDRPASSRVARSRGRGNGRKRKTRQKSPPGKSRDR